MQRKPIETQSQSLHRASHAIASNKSQDNAQHLEKDARMVKCRIILQDFASTSRVLLAWTKVMQYHFHLLREISCRKNEQHCAKRQVYYQLGVDITFISLKLGADAQSDVLPEIEGLVLKGKATGETYIPG